MKTFIDLFAGLGGFHLGLSRAGYQCVFASEIDADLASLYEKNFGLKPVGDIREVEAKHVPRHDILCAGFPCQPFSSAGKKQGAKCPKSGKLIDEVLRIVEFHHPEYILLENVPQIITIQNGEFWEHINSSLERLGYQVSHKVYSPKQFGIPQNRERVFVVASKRHVVEFEDRPELACDINSILVHGIKHRLVEEAKVEALEHWQQYLDNIEFTYCHTVLAAEFGATYPLTDLSALSIDELARYKGAFGEPLDECRSHAEIYAKLPEYIAKKNGKMSEWITNSIIKSRKIYSENQNFLDGWIKNISQNTSWQKFEWRAERDNLNIFDKIIQFRASGIRISRPTHTPSLVAMTPTQIPIIGKFKRYLAPKEAAKLQALEGLRHLFPDNTKSFKALGNAVNAKIIYSISKKLAWG